MVRLIMLIPLLRGEIPVGDRTITQILSNQDIDTPNNVPHHAIPHDNHLLKPAQDLTDLFRREPPHVAPSWHIWSIVADAATGRHGR